MLRKQFFINFNFKNKRSLVTTVTENVKNSIYSYVIYVVHISENVVNVGFSIKSNSVIAFNNIRLEISSLK